MEYSTGQITEVIQGLKIGKIGIIPTDTIYGIVGSALNSKTVEKVYQLKKRQPDKPMIILISSVADLKLFNINLTADQQLFLEKLWPNPVSVILKCQEQSLEYLHRGTNSLAFRIPNDKMLLEILQRAGPLIAPSANTEGQKPAENVTQAKNYFDDLVDFYLDNGTVISKPSTLIKLDEKIEILRQGSFVINEKL